MRGRPPTGQSLRIMHTRRIALFFGFSLMLASIANRAATRTLTRAELLDKIRGGWAGQMIGVAYGAPTEFKSNGKIGAWDLAWKAGMLQNTIHQDDLYVEMTFAKVMDDFGLDAPIAKYGEAFRDSKYHLWHANAGARRALNNGIQPPWSGHPKFNLHADDIDFQIEADFIGLMSPGLPRESNRFCDRVGRVMNYGDGVYGGMFVCGMYASAYFESDPRKIVEAGLACIPPKSTYAALIADLLKWSADHPSDWRKVWQLVDDKWNRNDPCPDGALAPFNIDAKLNGAYIAFGLLFGGGDFEKTMEISTRCGQDSDCNPSSAAGVLGVVLGYERIPAKFKAEMPALENTKFDFTSYSFNDIVLSTEKRALALIEKTGGTFGDSEVTVKLQQPKPAKLERWEPGVPAARVAASDPAWQWTGAWTQEAGARHASVSGPEAVFTFDGSGVALQGRVDMQGGRADVYLDGKKMKTGVEAWADERTHDNVLWHAYGLKAGHHTLRIVPTGQADARSKGKRIAISEAIIYR